MDKLLDLPLELLPEILLQLSHPRDLRKACLVNKLFYQFTVPKLYERVSVFSWHKHGKEKVILLFRTLSHHPHLAKHVRRLELRDFPKALSSDDGIDFLQTVTDGLKNCSNLQSCTWTRDRSLNSDILEALQSSQDLQELEINGHDDGNYDPQLLLRFTGLRKISLIMPSSSVISLMRPWLQITGDSLRSLTIICKTSPLITDAKLELLAPQLTQLEHFYLTGCSRVTHDGINSILSANENGIVSLGLEGLSPKFDMSQFRYYCTHTNALRRLRSITLTVNQQTPLDTWIREVAELLPSTVPLKTFQMYSSGTFIESPATERLWSDLVTAHKDRLVRFSIHRMLISLRAIEDICRRCTQLEELFVVIEQGSVGALTACVSLSSSLRVVHINYPLEASQTENTIPILPESDVLAIVEQCSPNIMQFGCNTRVWQVGREVLLDDQGLPVGVRRSIMRYQGLDIPEAFMVVRT
ncbi:hypothetical protein BT96DRAFT_743267, partial [Gymnopus androsaceus JB14]